MKWFLRFCFLLAFAVLPLTVNAGPLPPPPPPPLVHGGPLPPPPPGPGPIKAPEFDPGTVSGGAVVLVGAGWLVLRRLRRNRKST